MMGWSPRYEVALRAVSALNTKSPRRCHNLKGEITNVIAYPVAYLVVTACCCSSSVPMPSALVSATVLTAGALPAQVPTYAAQRQVLNHKSEGLLFEVQLVRVRR